MRATRRQFFQIGAVVPALIGLGKSSPKLHMITVKEEAERTTRALAEIPESERYHELFGVDERIIISNNPRVCEYILGSFDNPLGFVGVEYFANVFDYIHGDGLGCLLMPLPNFEGTVGELYLESFYGKDNVMDPDITRLLLRGARKLPFDNLFTDVSPSDTAMIGILEGEGYNRYGEFRFLSSPNDLVYVCRKE